MISLQDLTIKDQEVKNVFAIDADIQEDSSGVGWHDHESLLGPWTGYSDGRKVCSNDDWFDRVMVIKGNHADLSFMAVPIAVFQLLVILLVVLPLIMIYLDAALLLFVLYLAGYVGRSIIMGN
jgi:hypothetical protein